MSADQGETAYEASEERPKVGENSKGTDNSKEDHSNGKSISYKDSSAERVTTRVKPSRMISIKRTLAPRNNRNKSGLQINIIHLLCHQSKALLSCPRFKKI